jgi:hypothetical protein
VPYWYRLQAGSGIRVSKECDECWYIAKCSLCNSFPFWQLFRPPLLYADIMAYTCTQFVYAASAVLTSPSLLRVTLYRASASLNQHGIASVQFLVKSSIGMSVVTSDAACLGLTVGRPTTVSPFCQVLSQTRAKRRSYLGDVCPSRLHKMGRLALDGFS